MSEPDTDHRPQISTILWITGPDFDPEAWTQMVGLSPTETGLKGQHRPGRRPPVPKSFWELSFIRERGDCIETGLKKLLDLLWPARVKITHHLKEPLVAGTFVSNVTIRNDGAYLCLTAETVSRLAHFSLDYGIDIFDYRHSTDHLPPQDVSVDTDNDLSAITSAFVIEAEDFDAGEFAHATGLLPVSLAVNTSTHARGRGPSSTLILDLQNRRLEDIDLGVSELLDLLWSFREPLGAYLKEKSISGRVISWVSIHKSRPIYELKADSLRRMAALNLSYCLEIFDYREDKIFLRMEEIFPNWQSPQGRRPKPS